jgi:L-seryl-tRNA(Ser) seleniumtransferase
MIAMTAEDLRRRARRFARRMKARLPEDERIHLMSGESVVGGGSCPEHQLPTTLIAFEPNRLSPNAIESRLRAHEPPIILRMEEDRLLVDLRTVFPAQESLLVEGLCKAVVSG